MREDSSTPAGATRSQLFLETLSELVSRQGFEFLEADVVHVRPRELGGELFTLVGGDSPATLARVVRQEVTLATLNPSALLTMAHLGAGPFTRPLPLRALAVIPARDWLGFAVHTSTGLRSLSELVDRRLPLRISVRPDLQHAAHAFLHEVCATYGFSLQDVEAWGGEVTYESRAERFRKLERGELDAVFDRGVNRFGGVAAGYGLRFLSVDDWVLQQVEQLGMRRSIIPAGQFPGVTEDVRTLDFSGLVIYTHADTPSAFVHAFCRALDARRGSIRWEQPGPLPVATMCRDTSAGPLGVPLHPGAERYWREAGYLR